MKRTYWLAAILLAGIAGVELSAQSGPTGTWQVEGAGPSFPWQVVLRGSGPRLTGAVSNCGSPRAEIADGHLDGNVMTFKCKAPGASDRTITFTGRISGDEIAFTWELKGNERLAPNAAGMFGASAPSRIIAKRVPDGALAEFADHVRGIEVAGAVNLLQKDVMAEGKLFLPQSVDRARAVIVVMFGLGWELYEQRQWRKLAETLDAGLLHLSISNISTVPTGDVVRNAGLGGADAFLTLLQRLAQESGHAELAEAPLFLWGHSATGSFAATFATLHPQRTIAFVRYHSAGAGLVGLSETDRKALSGVPALLFAAGKDSIQPEAVQASVTGFRSMGAPWAFAFEPDATHGDPEDVKKANALVIPWVTAIVRQRLSPGTVVLRKVTDESAWLGNVQTGDVASFRTFAGSKAEANWLPDETSARAWRALVGFPR